MNIGSIALENKTVMAPLAGITNLPFRLMVKDAGCGLVCSEMVSSNGLVYKSEKTEQLLDSASGERPLSVQIFGSDPGIMAEAAAMVEESGADIIDINCGCSVRKVLKTGSGSALMRTPDKAEAIIKAVRAAVRIPFTIKIRSGWDRTYRQAHDMAKMAQDCGVDAIAVHPRTAVQGFGGVADWSLIADIKKELSIPVIGNGDIKVAEDAVRMLDETGCDGVMIGRAAMGNPMIFSQVNALLAGKTYPKVDLDRHFEIMKAYLDVTVTYFGEKKACFMMRSRLAWFAKGLRGCSVFRRALAHLSSAEEAVRLMDEFYGILKENQRAEGFI